MKKIITMIICVAIPVCVGLVSGFLTKNNMVVFDRINKPPLTPPSMVFPIAWAILYVMMGVASYFAITNCADGSQKLTMLVPYAAQLILNFAWSLIFFNAEAYGVAFVCLVFMQILIIRTAIYYLSVSKLAFFMMLPYIVWVTFAGYLNLGIIVLNR